MDNKTFDELVSSMYEAATIHKLLRVARAAKKYLDAELFTGQMGPAEDELEEALKEVENLL